MSNTQIKTHLIHLHDIAENWDAKTDFIPKQGEFIVYDDRYTKNGVEVVVADSVRYKIGDGKTLLKDLPFAESSGGSTENSSSITLVRYANGEIPVYSVDLSQLKFPEDYFDNPYGAYPNEVIINSKRIVLMPNNRDELIKYNNVSMLTIGVNGSGASNSVSYKMGDITYTIAHNENGSRELEYHTIELTDDVIVTYTDEIYCLTGDTLIAMADGTYKRIDEVKVGDSVRAIDPETLEIVTDIVTYSDAGNDKTSDHYDVWTFSDGTVIKTVARHRFYNIEKQAMTYMDEWAIGEHAYNENGELIELISHERIYEDVKFYTIFTEKNTYFANGLLSGNRRTAKFAIN